MLLLLEFNVTPLPVSNKTYPADEVWKISYSFPGLQATNDPDCIEQVTFPPALK